MGFPIILTGLKMQWRRQCCFAMEERQAAVEAGIISSDKGWRMRSRLARARQAVSCAGHADDSPQFPHSFCNPLIVLALNFWEFAVAEKDAKAPEEAGQAFSEFEPSQSGTLRSESSTLRTLWSHASRWRPGCHTRLLGHRAVPGRHRRGSWPQRGRLHDVDTQERGSVASRSTPRPPPRLPGFHLWIPLPSGL